MNIGAGIGVGFSNPREEPFFEYEQSQACKNGSDVTPIINNPGGTFSASPAGLSINSSTGVIDVSASTEGTYTVTYSIGPTTDTITILPADNSSFSYSASSFRQNASNPAPTITGLVGGVFSAPSGIIFADSGTNTNSSSGIINLAASTIGGPYTITYTTTGDCPTSSTFDVTVLVTLSITYSAAAFCEDGGNTAAPTVVGDSGSGTFAANPAGLTINSSSGVINTDTSVPGDGNPYTVTYTASTGETATTQVTIKNLDNATFTYSSTSFCENASNQTPSITSPGGTFTSQDITFSPFQMKFDTNGGKTIVIPGTIGSSFTVDWGDGTTTTETTYGISHTYASGIATAIVSIGAAGDTGPFTGFNPLYTSGGSANDLIDIVQWGSIAWTTFYRAFANTPNLGNISATDTPDLSNVSSMQLMFYSSSIGTANFNNWDISNVSDIHQMFRNSPNYRGDMANWNFVNNNNISLSFYMASSSGVYDGEAGNWNVSGVSTFDDCFRYQTGWDCNLADWYINGFNQVNIPTMYRMFRQGGISDEQYTDSIVGWAVAVKRDGAPYNVAGPSQSPASFLTSRTQNTDNNGNTVDYSAKYGSDWDSTWSNAGDARQFLINNGWSIA